MLVFAFSRAELWLVIVVVPNTKQTNWLHKQYHVKTSPCFYQKLYLLFFQMESKPKIYPELEFDKF